MGRSAKAADEFYDEVLRHGVVWTIRDDGGCPAPMTAEGRRSQPFWSTRERAGRIIRQVPAYAGFDAVSIQLSTFLARWLPDLRDEGLLVGVNWSGKQATGFDVDPSDVVVNLGVREAPVPADSSANASTPGDRRARS